jgi:Spy/CpxP family protein refolding chaperone
MKKLLLLSLIFSAVISTTIYAQSGSGPSVSAAPQQAKEVDWAAMLQQTKEKVKPLMIEKTGLTDAQADKVIEINFEMRQAASGLRDLTEADRATKIAELKAAKEKKLSELLTAEQLKSVKTFYEEMGKNMQKKPGN